MIHRRRVITRLAGGLLAAPFAAVAQPPAKRPHIGVLANEDNRPWQDFRQGLRELGYVDGRTVTLEWRWSEGRPERHPALAAELVGVEVDVIVTSGAQAARAAMQATRTIPIVMAVSSYPERIGLVESLARPGGNVTGLSHVSPELMGKRLELLKEIAPAVRRIALLMNPGNPIEPLGLREVQAAAAVLGMQIQPVEVRVPDDLTAAFAAVASSGAQALQAFGNPINFRGRQQIVDFALASRMPSVFEDRLFVDSGGLLSYAPSSIEMMRRAASYVDRILKGARAADLPVEQPTHFELVINLKTAKALGLAIPQSLLLRADEVIR